MCVNFIFVNLLAVIMFLRLLLVWKIVVIFVKNVAITIVYLENCIKS